MAKLYIEDQHSYENLKAEMAVTAGGDPWGWCMSWWFAVAGAVHERGEPVPAEWFYRPGADGGVDLENFEDGAIAELSISTPALIHAGNVLSRYAQRCKHAGLDY